jgi:hypothetical protein
MEVKKVLVSAFLLTTCLMSGQAQRRNEIQVPDLDGYTTLKCDFHMHSVFSDGLVWPTVRVDEAYRDGLDAISLTEHIEYRPHKQDVVSDHNRSFDLCREQAEKLGILLIKGSEITRAMAPGHFNAIFLSDSNPLEQKDYKDAFREAKKQGAFMFWNHPGWDSQQPDTTKWWPKHKSALLFGFTKSILVVFLFQWIGIRQEDGIKVSGCHGSRNLTALNQKYPQLLSLFPTKVERTVMIRNNILFVRAVLNMFCQ